MPHFVLLYDLAPEYLVRRPEFRSEHLALAWSAADRGSLILGGALGDPVESAMLLFRGAAEAEAFAAADPYVANRLVKDWRVIPWATVVGADAAQPALPE